MGSSRSASGSRRRNAAGVPRARRRLIVAYLLVLFSITLAPIPADAAAQLTIAGYDKVIHALVIGGLALMLHGRPGTTTGIASAAFAVLAASAVAGLIELFQEPLPYRSGDPRDFLAGVAGALSAVAVSINLQGLWARRRSSDPGGDSTQLDSEDPP